MTGTNMNHIRFFVLICLHSLTEAEWKKFLEIEEILNEQKNDLRLVDLFRLQAVVKRIQEKHAVLSSVIIRVSSVSTVNVDE